MTGHHSRNQTGERCAPVGIEVAAVMPVIVGQRGSHAGQREFALRRQWVQTREEESANRGNAQKPTERGQDKSRQCAARSGSCFSWAFSRFRQCPRDPRKVRADIKVLPRFNFSHIAEAGDG
jgi:hypothetical protein